MAASSSVWRRWRPFGRLTANRRVDPSRSATVNYFDLGTHLGQEVDLVLAECCRSWAGSMKVRVLMFEPHPFHFARLVQKYRRCRLAEFVFFNCAVAARSGVGRLYLHPNDLGHSIYHDKSGVTSEFVPVITTPLSMLVAEFPKHQSHVNILKANIEGAELDLLEDLAAHGLHRYFDLYLGSTPGRFNDIGKVTSLRNAGKVDRAAAILEDLGITIHKFCTANPQWPNFDLSGGVEQVLRNREARAA
jgi:FkbM family methyltransferase